MSNETKGTIGLFGGTGATGSSFLQLALDAGYIVKALVRTPSKVTITNDNLTLVEGSITDAPKVEEVITGCDYVVSMLGLMNNLKKYPKDMMLDFVKMVLPLMDKAKTKVFLYQGGNMNPAPGETKPFVSKFMRFTYGNLTGLEKALKDHDQVISYLSEQKDTNVKIIVTRPPGMKPGDSEGKAKVISAVKVTPVAFVDVAQFSLDALVDESLYGTYPLIGY